MSSNYTSDVPLLREKKMDMQSRYYRMRREDIAYFKFIIESYEGMAVVRTKDPREAVIELMVAPGWEKEVDVILEALRSEVAFESWPGSGSPAS